jgi:hypothetical protein
MIPKKNCPLHVACCPPSTLEFIGFTTPPWFIDHPTTVFFFSPLWLLKIVENIHIDDALANATRKLKSMYLFRIGDYILTCLKAAMLDTMLSTLYSYIFQSVILFLGIPE